MKSGYIDFNKGKIYYEITSFGNPIVFVNGFTLDRRMWEEQVKYFSKNYQIVTYDIRGFGKSSLPTDNYSHEDDLKELISTLKLKNIILIGLSLGGEISLNYSLQNISNVKKLVLADSSLGGYKSTVDWNVHGKKENWLNHELFNSTKKNPKAYEKVKKIINDYSGWHFVNDDFWDKVDKKAINLLDKLTVPTLVITGENDLSYFHNIANYIATHTPNVTKKSIKNSGHMVNMEQPKEFNKLVDDFILT